MAFSDRDRDANTTAKYTRKTLTASRCHWESLKASGKAHALLGLGSVGIETERLDQFSDVDFFAIVQEGNFKQYFLDSLHWLSDILPIDYAVRNTVDGYKSTLCRWNILWVCGIPNHELAHIPFAEGRIVWRKPTLILSVVFHQQGRLKRDSPEWIIGEALTNLYVGMSRYNRGEKLSGSRFVQSLRAWSSDRSCR